MKKHHKNRTFSSKSPISSTSLKLSSSQTSNWTLPVNCESVKESLGGDKGMVFPKSLMVGSRRTDMVSWDLGFVWFVRIGVLLNFGRWTWTSFYWKNIFVVEKKSEFCHVWNLGCLWATKFMWRCFLSCYFDSPLCLSVPTFSTSSICISCNFF